MASGEDIVLDATTDQDQVSMYLLNPDGSYNDEDSGIGSATLTPGGQSGTYYVGVRETSQCGPPADLNLDVWDQGGGQ